MANAALPRAFYDRSVIEVARDLLGNRLVRQWNGDTITGLIVEVEAYLAKGDPASHSYRGPTRRNASMFGPAGHAYVYTIHTRHCLNVVCEPVGCGAAVLIRAVEPEHGGAWMARHRRCQQPLKWARGPGRLCEAFALDLSWDGWDLTLGEGLWLEPGPGVEPFDIVASPRIGIRLGADLPLRFFVRGHRFVSGPRHFHGVPRLTLSWVPEAAGTETVAPLPYCRDRNPQKDKAP